jgi:hypothetical protein
MCSAASRRHTPARSPGHPTVEHRQHRCPRGGDANLRPCRRNYPRAGTPRAWRLPHELLGVYRLAVRAPRNIPRLPVGIRPGQWGTTVGEQSSQSPKRRLLVWGFSVGGASLSAILVVIVLAALVLDAEVVDVHQVLPLPPELQRMTRDDQIAYTYHAALATALSATKRWSPAGVQWFKAAAHARSPDQTLQATEGLARALQSGSEAENVASLICRLADRGAHDGQRAALAQAGEFCGAAAISSTATVRPSDVTRGEFMDITVTCTSPLALTASIAVAIWGPAGQRRLLEVYDNQTFAAGETKYFRLRVTVGESVQVGAYELRVGSTVSALAPNYAWSPPVAAVSVHGPEVPGLPSRASGSEQSVDTAQPSLNAE